jgi:hypothetical protein
MGTVGWHAYPDGALDHARDAMKDEGIKELLRRKFARQTRPTCPDGRERRPYVVIVDPGPYDWMDHE